MDLGCRCFLAEAVRRTDAGGSGVGDGDGGAVGVGEGGRVATGSGVEVGAGAGDATGAGFRFGSGVHRFADALDFGAGRVGVGARGGGVGLSWAPTDVTSVRTRPLSRIPFTVASCQCRRKVGATTRTAGAVFCAPRNASRERVDVPADVVSPACYSLLEFMVSELSRTSTYLLADVSRALPFVSCGGGGASLVVRGD